MGIGAACARVALSAGAKVAIVARNGAILKNMAAELSAYADPSRIADVSVDVSDSSSVDYGFIEVERRLGQINGVIHAAAILGPIGPIVDLDDEAWLDTLKVNLFGTFLVVRKAARLFQSRGGGRIVAFAGGGASNAWPNYSAYASSKVAVVRFIETVAKELADSGVELNAIAPGFVVTRMQTQTLAAGDRAGAEYLQTAQLQIANGGVSPDIAANLAAFLVSDRASGITGKFVSAVHDDWVRWPEHVNELRGTDIFTLRRILPKDRGMSWQ